MDEPTSSVDPKNEQAIYSAVFRRMKDKTIISAVHRVSLLPATYSGSHWVCRLP